MTTCNTPADRVHEILFGSSAAPECLFDFAREHGLTVPNMWMLKHNIRGHLNLRATFACLRYPHVYTPGFSLPENMIEVVRQRHVSYLNRTVTTEYPCPLSDAQVELVLRKSRSWNSYYASLEARMKRKLTADGYQKFKAVIEPPPLNADDYGYLGEG